MLGVVYATRWLTLIGLTRFCGLHCNLAVTFPYYQQGGLFLLVVGPISQNGTKAIITEYRES